MAEAGAVYATVEELIKDWRALTADETERAEAMLAQASAMLRVKARSLHKDLDKMIEADPDFEIAVNRVVLDVVERTMQNKTQDGPAVSQFSESAGGYSVSGTYLTPSRGMTILDNELKALGLLRQVVGWVDPYGLD